MQEVATLIDMRFGHGTWKSIVDERARRLQEEKAKAMEARRIQIQKAKEIEELFQTILLVIAIVVAVVIVIVIAINII